MDEIDLIFKNKNKEKIVTKERRLTYKNWNKYVSFTHPAHPQPQPHKCFLSRTLMFKCLWYRQQAIGENKISSD